MGIRERFRVGKTGMVKGRRGDRVGGEEKGV